MRQYIKITLIFCLLFLLRGGGATIGSPDYPGAISWVLPQEILRELRQGDLYVYLADRLAEKRRGGIRVKDLDRELSNLLQVDIVQSSDSMNDLAVRINQRYKYWSRVGGDAGVRALLALMKVNNQKISPRELLIESASGNDPVENRYARLKIFGFIINGAVPDVENEPGLYLNEFRLKYNRFWIYETYLWLKKSNPALYKRIVALSSLWDTTSPVYVEGSVADRPDDPAKENIYTATSRGRLDAFLRAGTGRNISFYTLNWSRSSLGPDGEMIHPTAAGEHTNFPAQFLGALELIHIMRKAANRGEPVDIMTFSAGANVLLMAAKIFHEEFLGARPLGNLIMVQASIFPGTDLSGLKSLQAAGADIFLTRNSKDTFYLGAATKSLGLAGGGELFGYSEGIGLVGPTDKDSQSLVHVLDISGAPVHKIENEFYFGPEPSPGEYTSNPQNEHWSWFYTPNLSYLISLLRINSGRIAVNLRRINADNKGERGGEGE